jgi:putrescine transport system ATP-binding protein
MLKKKIHEFKTLEPWQDPSKTPYISIESIGKTFNGFPALTEVSLNIYKGEFFSLLGPSGCGKSTLLRILSGLEMPDTGRILIDGTDITALPPHERPINMMFQSYALFPHMTVFQNVAFGLKQENLSKKVIADRVGDMLALVQLEKYGERRPHQLSGGQKQRAALARCLVKKPKLVLLDEPLGALDKKLREQTQFELVNIQEKVGVTFIMVTHDQAEAMTMSTRLAVMEEGHVRQLGTPNEIYEYPNSAYVANFIGDINLFHGVVMEEDADYTLIKSPDLKTILRISRAGSTAVGSQVSVAIRPEKITLYRKKPKEKYNYSAGIVSDIAYMGDVCVYYIEVESTNKIVQVMLPNFIRQESTPITWNDKIYLSWHAQNALILAT